MGALEYFTLMETLQLNRSSRVPRLSHRSDLTNILHELNQYKGSIYQDHIDVNIINSFNQIFNQTQKYLGMMVAL